MPLGTEVGIDPGDIVLDGDRAHRPNKGHNTPNFSTHSYSGQTAAWIKMPLPLRTEVDIGPGHIVLDGTQLPL